MEEHSEQYSLHSPKKVRKTDVKEVGEMSGRIPKENNEFSGASNQSVTIVSILRQGIQSKDKNMLENALSHNDSKIIRSSVNQISDVNSLELFEEVMNRIEDNPMKLLELSNWVTVLLERIGKQVVAFKGDTNRISLILNQMERLNEIISMRLSYNQDLITLQSTLDIFQHIIEENKLITEMCNKLSSESDNALITYQFEAEQENDENDHFDNNEEDEEDGNDDDDDDDDDEDEDEDEDDDEDDDDNKDGGNEEDIDSDDEKNNESHNIRQIKNTKNEDEEDDDEDDEEDEEDDDEDEEDDDEDDGVSSE
ncbi:uncharacterized protein cubi_03727 [Cryptosporidium ubiquitum]|uniref:Uncharacterized protein n=1 Tax=Cryptosporidium ubiquitum TaxID=857276 RepID=A0A1J4MM23_9CRYT|nr:uncharacterized protein cubi_03727 [Cryptosporidium ubiquitum]OII75248.1 hypothetical protein cubi_03727 [Cryptosporidium ubiquitum]